MSPALLPAYRLSLAVAFLAAAAALAGLLFPEVVYPTDELRQAFVPNDAVTLALGLPALLGLLYFARRGSLAGLLLWPGALLYVTYNSLAYALALPQSLPGALNAALVVMCVFSIARIFAGVNAADIQMRLRGNVHERLAGGVLTGLGSLFLLRGVAQVAGALSGQIVLSTPELAVSAADVLITPVWILGGIWLWRRQGRGYVWGAAALFQASLLFAGLLVLFALQPVLLGVPFAAVDFVVIFSMGLVVFIPCGLFIRALL